ncbi:MAG: Gfo/Idh/MocA family oxidoreductase [Phycisphaerae bacterium]
MPDARDVSLCMVGLGSWGRNVLHAFARTPRCRLAYLCDVDAATLAREAAPFPAARAVRDLEAALADAAVDAVAIAADAPQHAPLARAALQAGKHVFVEKPIALAVADARELIDLARRANRRLMVGHLLEYHPAVEAIERMLSGGELGRIYYAYSQRINLGVVRRQENAWWSLAPHDIAMICRLFDAEPVAVSAQGQCFLQPGVEDVVFTSLQFGDGRLAHIHVSWLDPHKVRKLTLVGARRMVVFDDMSANEKLWVYDKGAERGEAPTAFPDVVTLRVGDIAIPRLAGDEPLRVECRHFIDAILDGRAIRSDGESGLRVVRILEAGQRSLRGGGGRVHLRDIE